MSLFDLLTPSVGSVAIPPGEPEVLRSAAARFSSSAALMETEAAEVTSIASSVTDGGWFGLAATAFRAAAQVAASDARTSSDALSWASTELRTLATQLQAAQEKARRAQAAAAEIDAASARLDASYADAQAAEAAAASSGKPPTGVSAIPGLIVQAGALQMQALGVRGEAAAAEEMARDAQRRAAAAFQEIAIMAPSVQRRLAAERAALAAAAEEEEGDGEPGGVLGVLYDASKPFQWAADKGEDVVRGAWNGVAEPVGMVVDLVNPFDSDGFFGDWKNLGSGLWYGVTHPLEFGKALIGWDVLKEEGVFYWAGNLIPGAVAAFFTGGASAALRGGSASARVLENTEDVLDAASDVQRIERSVDAAEDVDDAVAAARAGDDVPEGRTDLSRGFTEDLENFTPGSATFHSGPTDGDMTLVQYFDADNPGSTKWWTSADEANSFETMDDVIEGLALSPDWGPRTGVRVAHIPEGTDVSFLHGTAGPQYPSTGGRLDGGAEQFRFLDFDEDWVVSTRRLP